MFSGTDTMFDCLIILSVYHLLNAHRCALLAAGEGQVQKRKPLQAQKNAQKRRAYQPSSARCVGRHFKDYTCSVF
jgi:hypothetical protein